MNNAPGYLLVSGLVSVLFTSALVIAQPPVPAPPIAITKEVQTQVVKSERTLPGAAAKAVMAKQAANQNGLAAARAANLENLIQQFMYQGRPAVRAELIFVRKICRLDQEPFRRIDRDAAAALKSVATKLAEAQQQGRMPGQIRKATAQTPRTVDGFSILHEELAAVMKNDLTAEQFAHYQAESEKRNANRRQAAIRYLLSTIDQELYLSDEQRVKLTESLSSHWDDSWTMTLEYLLYGNQFHPLGVDPLVTPYLNAAQTKVWQGSQKIAAVGGHFGVWGNFLNDNDALEEELGQPKRAEPQNKLQELRNNMMQMAPVRVEMKKAVARDAIPKK